MSENQSKTHLAYPANNQTPLMQRQCSSTLSGKRLRSFLFVSLQRFPTYCVVGPWHSVTFVTYGSTRYLCFLIYYDQRFSSVAFGLGNKEEALKRCNSCLLQRQKTFPHVLSAVSKRCGSLWFSPQLKNWSLFCPLVTLTTYFCHAGRGYLWSLRATLKTVKPLYLNSTHFLSKIFMRNCL